MYLDAGGPRFDHGAMGCGRDGMVHVAEVFILRLLTVYDADADGETAEAGGEAHHVGLGGAALAADEPVREHDHPHRLRPNNRFIKIFGVC